GAGKEPSLLRRWQFPGLLHHLLEPLELFFTHGDHPKICLCSQPRAKSQSRLTVAGERSISLAISSQVSPPPKKRSSTTRLERGSSSSSRASASSSAIRSGGRSGAGKSRLASRMGRWAPPPG